MQTLRYILVLWVALSFAGRAVAQWSLFDLDAALAQTTLSPESYDASEEADSGCCCDDESGEDGDCCDDPCNMFSCPMMMEPISPEADSSPAIMPGPGHPLLFETSRWHSDGWSGGLERPPRNV